MNMNVKCHHCQNFVFLFDAIFDEGKHYHEQCYRFWLSSKIGKLERKVKNGSITLEESYDLREHKEIMENVTKDFYNSDPPASKLFNSAPPRFLGNTPWIKKFETERHQKLLKDETYLLPGNS